MEHFCSAAYTVLGRHLGSTVDAGARRELLGGLSIDIARRAQRDWFTNLGDEIARHHAGTPVSIPEEAPSLAPGNDGGGDGASRDSGDILDGDGSSGASDDILGGDGSNAESGDILGTDGSNSESGDILGGDASKPEATDILGGSSDGDGDILSSDGGSGGAPPNGAVKPTEAPAIATVVTGPTPENWSDLGGWYVDGFAIWYRPAGHADPFLRAWMTLGGRSTAATAPRDIFETLVGKESPGKCAKCHSIDAMADGTAGMNWIGKQSRPGVQNFTRFVHAPHFQMVGGSDACAKCHQLKTGGTPGTASKGRDPRVFESSFKPIDQAVCAKCHAPAAAGNACTSCHDYHVGDVATKMPATRLEAVRR